MHRAVLMTVVPCPIRRMDREMHTVRTICICKTAMADKFCCYSSHGRLQHCVGLPSLRTANVLNLLTAVSDCDALRDGPLTKQYVRHGISTYQTSARYQCLRVTSPRSDGLYRDHHDAFGYRNNTVYSLRKSTSLVAFSHCTGRHMAKRKSTTAMEDGNAVR